MTLHKLNIFAQDVVNQIMSADSVDIEEDIPPDHSQNKNRIPISNVYLSYDRLTLIDQNNRKFEITNEEFNKAFLEEDLIFVSNLTLSLYNLHRIQVKVKNEVENEVENKVEGEGEVEE
jgi:hypothetical protein